ncbi:hypothetical protein KEJ45_01805 [Candidatus Bathyarchaeota archaeon]|nr:hypothetical protein [Candidatus Bathyarchaeota archaeon]
MTEGETETSQTIEPQAIITATPIEDKASKGETAIERLKGIQENVGQMFELAKEEGTLVNEFFNTLATVLKPFCEVLEVAVSSLPKIYQTRAIKAFLDRHGRLILVNKNGEVETLDLTEQRNHDVVVAIVDDVVAKLETLLNAQRSKVEKRVKFLTSVTKELQKIAKVFAEI